MGRDKALLPSRTGPLVSQVASIVAGAAGSVTLVGCPERYRHLFSYSVVADQHPDAGPLGGIHAALATTTAEWNLIVACDMPDLSVSLLGEMLNRAEELGVDCLAARSPSGLPEPLCAVYHRRCVEGLRKWLDSGRRKAADWLASLRVVWHPVAAERLRNLNTPEDWNRHIEALHG